MSDALGFGRPLDYQPWISFPGAIGGEWQGQIRLVADALGVEVQEVRENFDRAMTNRTLNVAMGTVEAGTCGALRMQAIGVVEGREAIVIEHVTRLAHDVAPDWPTGIGDLSYRVVITGDPDIGRTHRGDAQGSAPGRSRRDDLWSRCDGRHRDASSQRRAVCRCGTTWVAEFGGPTVDNPAQCVCHAMTFTCRRASRRSGPAALCRPEIARRAPAQRSLNTACSRSFLP